MSQPVFVGFVVIDGEEVLTYDTLRQIGFVGPTAENEYLAGMHGINGLFQICPTPLQNEVMDDHGLSIAAVTTPWFTDRRLASEPELNLEVDIVEDNGEILKLRHGSSGFTHVAQDHDSDDSVTLFAKLSISMYSTHAPVAEFNVRQAIGWDSPVPVMPSPADVLKQLGSPKSLEEQFAEAFKTAPATFPPSTPFVPPAPVAPVAPQWTPPAPAPYAAQPQMAPAPEPAPAPSPVPVVKAPPLTHSDLMKTMFPRF